MSKETPLTDDQRMILAARALAGSSNIRSTDLSDARISEWANGKPGNPTTSDGVYMAMEIIRRRSHIAMILNLADRLELVVRWCDEVTKERAAAATAAWKFGREELLAEIKAEPFKFIHGLGYRIADIEIRRLKAEVAAPAPVAIALRETFAVEFSLTPATAASLVSGEDERILSDDERNAGGDQAIRIRVTIKGGDDDVRVYRMGPNELGEQVWHDVEFSSTTFHGLYLDEETAIALAFRFLTLTRRGADEPILSLGEF